MSGYFPGLNRYWTLNLKYIAHEHNAYNKTDMPFMFLFCLVFAMSLCASVYMRFVVTCWERAGLLALVCGV